LSPKSTILFFLFVIAFKAETQNKFKIDTNFKPKDYLYHIFDTNNVKFSNIKFRGQKSAIGKFSFDVPAFEIKKGLALSSGDLGLISVGNKTPGTSGIAWDNQFRFKGDRDLGKLSKGKVCDQVFIEFDFIPLENEIKFNYIFASEEYKEYVGSRFNDVFGFIITGDGNFWQNIALLPGKSDPVTINNINHLRNSELFINNNCFANSKVKKEVDDMAPREPFIREFFQKIFGGVDKTFSIDKDVYQTLNMDLYENFEFDGLTRRLQATCFLTPYKVYHMKIAVGDVGDPMFDSGVFIEYQSFTATKNINEPFFKDYQNLRGTINFDSLFQKKVEKPIIIDSPRQIEERFEITNVNFDYNKFDIPDSSDLNIRELSIYLKKNKEYRVHLLGYTDNKGTVLYNQKLSEERSKSVRNLLVKYGVSDDRINYIGNNFADPLAKNNTEEGRSKNRRVEIVVLE
jgi:outer membrane protein OmpA-like peptidoglycan-associated protein